MKKYLKYIGIFLLIILLSTTIMVNCSGPELKAEAIASIDEIVKIELVETNRHLDQFTDESIM